MSKRVTPDKLVDDLQVVDDDAEALLKATAAQTGEKIQEPRARTEESLRRVGARWVARRGSGRRSALSRQNDRR